MNCSKKVQYVLIKSTPITTRKLDSRARGPEFDTWSGHILSFLLPLIQEGQVSVTGESLNTSHWFTALEVWTRPGTVMVRSTDRPDMT